MLSNWLPAYDTKRTDLTRLNTLSELKVTLNGFPALLDLSIFGHVNGAKGAECILFPSDAEKIKRYQRRYKPPRPLAIQRLLQRALVLKERLDMTPGLTRFALAKHLGLDPSRITQIRNLLNLAPQIQTYIRNLPPTKHHDLISDHHWMRLSRIRNQELQLRKFGHLQRTSQARHKSCR